jgi:hypothetical protein
MDAGEAHRRQRRAAPAAAGVGLGRLVISEIEVLNLLVSFE